MDRVREAVAAPWKVANELRRRLAEPAIRLRFALHGVRWGRDWKVFGMPIIQRQAGSTIELGDGLHMRSWTASNPLAPNHPMVLATRRAGAVLKVGAHCQFTGATLVAAERLEIGDRVIVGANATLVDTDFHPLSVEERRRDFNAGATAPLFVEDDVFIGTGALILKGVRLGRGSVIGAGSVVTSDVPPGMIAAGNPARPLRPV
jgi:acetyltransferase-like isoleucine patch superfamily enzyme